MTDEQFRRDPEMTKHFRELLQDPVMQQAIVIMRDGLPAIDVPIGSDALASVRVLSQRAGADRMINHFLTLAEPLEPEQAEIIPDWEVPKPDNL